MSRRFLTVFGVLACLLLLAAPSFVQAEAYAYSEGIHFFNARGYTIAHQEITVDATKMVEGSWRQTWVHVTFHGPGANPWYINQTVLLLGDPDGLEVSEDLGWGGLQGRVYVYEQTQRRWHRLDFRISQFARTPHYFEIPGTWYFAREAYLDGYILMDGAMWIDFRWPQSSANVEYAYNFSDQWPGY